MNSSPSRRNFCNLLLTASAAPIAFAQDAPYPSRPIRIIIGAPAGGSADLLARLLGERLTRAWGQPVVVDSRPGANQAIGIVAVGKAAPDGYTLFLGSTAYTTNLALRDDANYGPNDHVPISYVAAAPHVIVAPSNLKVDTLQQFLALARAQRGKFTFGSSGVGSVPHYNGELLNVHAKTNLIHVPYKGDTAMVSDLITGEITLGFLGLGAVASLAKAGRVKIIGVTGDRRMTALPAVPTAAEAGFPLIAGYLGVLGTAGTPSSVVEKLSTELAKIAKMPDVAQKIEEWGFSAVGGTSEEFKTHLAQEFLRWKAAAAATGIKLG